MGDKDWSEAMKRPSTHVFILVVSCALALMLVAAAAHYSLSDAGGPTDAAFRDGLFLGRQDAEHGRKPHLSTGRWNLEADRRLFVSGYIKAFGEMFGGAGDEPQAWQRAEQRGYRDGITDGFKQRRGSKQFQVRASENYARADGGYSGRMGDVSRHKQFYREAYCAGYQQGYYGGEEKIESAKFAQLSQVE
jgi:hypothetical protein